MHHKSHLNFFGFSMVFSHPAGTIRAGCRIAHGARHRKGRAGPDPGVTGGVTVYGLENKHVGGCVLHVISDLVDQF